MSPKKKVAVAIHHAAAQSLGGCCNVYVMDVRPSTLQQPPNDWVAAWWIATAEKS